MGRLRCGKNRQKRAEIKANNATMIMGPKASRGSIFSQPREGNKEEAVGGGKISRGSLRAATAIEPTTIGPGRRCAKDIKERLTVNPSLALSMRCLVSCRPYFPCVYLLAFSFASQ